jgi:flagellin-like protein
MRRTLPLAPHRERKGVSEVLGALLLIVVVVAAVASLSVFLTQAQTNAQNRDAYIISVQDENLQVAYAQFYPNNPSIQWELDAANGSLSHSYYVQMISPSTVTITRIGSPIASYTETLVDGNFNNIATGVAATVTLVAPGVIDFSGTGYTFNPARWTNVTITVRNLNTAQSGIYQLKVNDNWMPQWEQVDQTGQSLLATGGPTMVALVVPAKSSVTLNLTLSTFDIAKSSSIIFTVLSSAGNFFTADYSPPVAVVKSSTTLENFQITTRDVLTFDGSQSFSTGSAVSNYMWRIDVPLVSAGCTSGAFSNPAKFDSVYVNGPTVQYTPESLFNPSQLTNDCISGPIRATLVVADDNGLLSTSQPIIATQDANIAPIGSLSASNVEATNATTSAKYATVIVQVNDIFGRSVVGAVVLIVKTSGDVTGYDSHTGGSIPLLSSVAMGAGGMVTFQVTWSTGGSIELELGNLPPVQMSFP